MCEVVSSACLPWYYVVIKAINSKFLYSERPSDFVTTQHDTSPANFEFKRSEIIASEISGSDLEYTVGAAKPTPCS